jgi:transcriptional regulator with XRE-family HTH domain
MKLKKIAEQRKLKGITQAELGVVLNVSRQTIQNYEQGVTDPDVDTIIKISKYFNISTDELFGLNKKDDYNQIVDELITYLGKIKK